MRRIVAHAKYLLCGFILFYSIFGKKKSGKGKKPRSEGTRRRAFP
ncbi:hypothetical protein CLOLEP_01176 [[Clostridium] leptum DSM 753]|uniref:Uncharacterized protein n=1 Tax=[Clostridium] leptum DSM 753 TaxID=428125 RepID=A7VRJ2_9FIRM|nr:hypothetical protein CLOLEP_01176 [[Clostridium] leptum DSM 753]